MDDPFRHHPGLKGLIAKPETSFFRDMDIDATKAKVAAAAGGDIAEMFTPDDAREAGRRAYLDRFGGGDLWVFAYGSLMWDPAVHFSEVRRMTVSGFARRFILKDIFGGRGTPEVPGLMVALDEAPGAECHGLVFRIAEDQVEEESQHIWKRERLGPAYHEVQVTGQTDQGTLQALSFIADHSAPLIDASLTFDQQVEYCATGTGFLGSSLEYAQNIAAQFERLRIEDADVKRLVAAAEAYDPVA